MESKNYSYDITELNLQENLNSGFQFAQTVLHAPHPDFLGPHDKKLFALIYL